MAQIQSGAAGLAKGAGRLVSGALKGVLGIVGSTAGRLAGPLRDQIPGMKRTTTVGETQESAAMMKLAGDEDWYPGPMIPGGG